MPHEQLQQLFRDLQAGVPRRVLFVYAHPDDETIAVGGHLALFRDALFVQVTDGAPADNADGERLGLSRDEYRATRILESRTAFAAAGLPEARRRALNYADKEAALHLAEITLQVAEILAAEQPHFILTHPYEAGHPDHDACAFAVHTAVAAMPEPRSMVVESPFYYGNPDGTMHTGSFLPPVHGEVLMLTLSEEQRDRKEASIAAFETQREVLANFRTTLQEESFREAPAYDFTRRIAPGAAFYESFVPGLSALRFTELAAEALARVATADQSVDFLNTPTSLAA